MPNAESVLAVAQNFECHDKRARRAHQGERGEGGNHEGKWDESEEHDHPDRAPSENSACRAPEEPNLREEVQRGAAAEPYRRHRDGGGSS